MFEGFWLFFVVVFRSSRADAAPATAPATELDFLFEQDQDCHRGGIIPC